jgi:sortase (surface protein transpeptidase)
VKSYLFLIIFWLISLISPGKQPPAAAKATAPNTVVNKQTVTLINTVKAEAPVVPQELIIPAINLDTRILQVDLNPENLVDVPPEDVGWYVRSARPGSIGNAVLQGHVRNFDLRPGIFGRLAELQAGDDIYTVDSEGKKLHFKVTAHDLVDADSFPVEQVYGGTDAPRLNLITCAGAFDSQKSDYLQRTIIYAQLATQ